MNCILALFSSHISHASPCTMQQLHWSSCTVEAVRFLILYWYNNPYTVIISTFCLEQRAIVPCIHGNTSPLMSYSFEQGKLISTKECGMFPMKMIQLYTRNLIITIFSLFLSKRSLISVLFLLSVWTVLFLFFLLGNDFQLELLLLC